MPNIIIGKDGVFQEGFFNSDGITAGSFVGDLVVGSTSGTTLYVQDGVSSTTKRTITLPFGQNATSLDYLPNRDSLIVTSLSDNIMREVGFTTGNLLNTFTHASGSNLRAITLNTKNNDLYTGDPITNDYYRMDGISGAVKTTFSGTGDSNQWGMTYNLDDETIITGQSSSDHLIRVYDLNFNLIRDFNSPFTGGSNRVSGMVYDPKTQNLISCDRNGTISVHNGVNQATINQFSVSGNGSPSGLAFV
jgi:WD40 repeat protein